MNALDQARARVREAPNDVSAWEALIAEMDAVAPSLPQQQLWSLAVDRWMALGQRVRLSPDSLYLRTLAEHLQWMGSICARNNQPAMENELRDQELSTLHQWMLLSEEPAEVAKRLVIRATPRAEQGQPEALSYLLRANYRLIEITGRPEYALRLAGIHVHYACQTQEESERRPHLEKALDLIERLEKAGLNHPLQESVKRDAREKLATLAT